MSRERFIDPAIWSSEQFCSVGRDARLLFIGCITMSDDCGFWVSNAHTMRLAIFPDEGDLSTADVRELRDHLAGAGLVMVLEQHNVIWLPSFFSYQPLKWRSRSKRLDALVKADLFGQELGPKGRVLHCWPNNDNIRKLCQTQAGSARLSQTLADSGSSCQVQADSGRTRQDLPGLGSAPLFPERGGEGSRGESRGGEARGETSVDVPLQSPCETSPPLTFDVDVPAAAKATAGNGPSGPGGNGRDHGNGASTEEATPDPLAPTPTVPDEPPIREKAKPDTDHEVTETSAGIVKRWTASETDFRSMDALRTYVRQFDRADPVRLLATLRDIETNGTIKHRLRVLYERLRGAKWKEPSEAAIAWAREQLNGPAGAGGAPSSIAEVMPEPAPTPAAEPPHDSPEAPPPTETPHVILAEFEYLTAGWSSSAHEDAARDVLARIIEVKPDYVLGHCYEINDQDPDFRGTTEWRELKVRLLSTESPSGEYLERAQKFTLAAGVTA
jgi:hypothetical protein